MKLLTDAFATGYGCLAAWSDTLDRINVFPVADGDTGTNLRLSLAPLRELAEDRGQAVAQLARSATGNSGNIAAAFFRQFVQAASFEELALWAERGRKEAWQAVARPRAGTMLTVFDRLVQTLGALRQESLESSVRADLRQAVLAGCRLIPELQQAGVVDAGALAMFIFLDGFFQRLIGKEPISVPVRELFAGKLVIDSSYRGRSENRFCVDAVLDAAALPDSTLQQIAALGESVVLVPAASRLKVHIHTAEPAELRTQLAAYGTVVDWSDEAIDDSAAMRLSQGGAGGQVIHLMSDAAGSFTRQLARQYGVSLLDSYIVAEDQSRPESLCTGEHLYHLLRSGTKVSTAQASLFERQLQYETITREHGRTLYLCVGSAFTGNYDTALAWKQRYDQGDLLELLDTGAASGRLGLITLLTARYGARAGDADKVIAYAENCCAACREYVFIDQLKYLVAGGRVSRAGGFFGDLLNMKPIITPTSSGVRKVGVVRNRQAQLDFALERLKKELSAGPAAVIMLQYSDNREWLEDAVVPAVTALLPEAEILLLPLSLTSGVHMGPGTWAVAFGDGSASNDGEEQ